MLKRIIATAFTLIALAGVAAADQITFEWDYDSSVAIDGFNLYSGPMGQLEDGTWAAKLSETPLFGSIPAESRSATVTENGWEGVSKKFGFAVRAFRGDNESADSNMVYVTIDNTPLAAPAALTGSYNPETSRINLTWTQADLDRAEQWKIYYKTDGEFTELGTVQNQGQADLIMDTPLTVVPAGQVMDVTFAVVAFKNDAVFSPNSNEFILTIDRSDSGDLPVVENFRLQLGITVE